MVAHYKWSRSRCIGIFIFSPNDIDRSTGDFDFSFDKYSAVLMSAGSFAQFRELLQDESFASRLPHLIRFLTQNVTLQ